jgi:hypothetical protein
MLEASVALGCPLNTAESCKGYLEDAGFEDVVEKEYRWPMSPWPRDRKLREIGKFLAWNISCIRKEMRFT